jgi:hypothetical protein
MPGELEWLRQIRRNLTITFDFRANDKAYLQRNWKFIHADILAWWRAYKAWEKVDTFDAAFRDTRMTVRTFNPGYSDQVQKTFARGKIQVTKEKFFADSRYTKFDPLDPIANEATQERHQRTFGRGVESQKYHAQRGIDSSAFAVPANFASRETKYDAGLHDLSASILNPRLPIFNQIHNTEEGAHFSFLPLSEMEDQEVIYNLTRIAKDRVTIPGLYDLVRTYRAEMTRVKLAYEMDMGIGYTVVPAPRPNRGPQYKLRYGLPNTTTIVGQKEAQPTTPDIYEARRKAALKFKSIVGIREGKNEIVIAIRKHAGPFPVYAVRRGDRLVCYTITPAKFMERTGYEIKDGKMVPLQKWKPDLPSVDTIGQYDYDDPDFTRDFEQMLTNMGDIPRSDGLHIVVGAAPDDPNFVRVRDALRLQVAVLNTKGYKLKFASEVDAKYKSDPAAVVVQLRHV